MKTREAHGLRRIGHNDLDGSGDGMQIMKVGDVVYVGHLGTSRMATSVLDVSDARKPVLVKQIPAAAGSHSHKVQTANGLLLVNEERFDGAHSWSAGMIVYDISDPLDPQRLGYFDCGGEGVHRIVWTGGRYAYMSATPDGFRYRIFLIVDMSDPERPIEAGRWWWPGVWAGGGEVLDLPEGTRVAAHHALLDGDIGYLGYGDMGMVVLDLTEVSSPRKLAALSWEPGCFTHTCLPLPGRKLVATTDEATTNNCQEVEKLVRLIDVSDPAAPSVVSTCPAPAGDFCERGLRFGPHNLHENRADSYRSETLLFATYFNAGVRVYDIEDAAAPREIAHWIPEAAPGAVETQINDLFVDEEGLIFVSDRVGGGLFVLEAEDDIAQRMSESRLPPTRP